MPRNVIRRGSTAFNQVSCIAIISVCLSFYPCEAQDLPSPTDPSIQFEEIIGEGLRNIESRKSDAFFAKGLIENARSIYNVAALWTSKTELKVCFWNGAASTQDAVVKSAMRWNGISRLNLSFTDSTGQLRKCVQPSGADIRISLDPTDNKLAYEAGQSRYGNWSLIGRQSTFPPRGNSAAARYTVTMNLPYIEQNLLDKDLVTLDFTVGHEFGHAFGLMHEFQSTICKGWIDVEQLAKDQHWSGNAADFNLAPLSDIAEKFRIDFHLSGDYDNLSIMQYNFAIKYFIVKPGQKNPCMRSEDVTNPSEGDRATLVAMYGKSQSTVIASNAMLLQEKADAARVGLKKFYKVALGLNQYDAPALESVIDHVKKLDAFEQGM